MSLLALGDEDEGCRGGLMMSSTVEGSGVGACFFFVMERKNVVVVMMMEEWTF